MSVETEPKHFRGRFANDYSDSEDSDVWDDRKLREAYDLAVQKANAEIAKQVAMNTNTNNKENASGKKGDDSKKAAVPVITEWYVGAPCRAIYTQDGLEYEAVITQILTEKECEVTFVGYGNKEKVRLRTLNQSKGERAVIDQYEMAMNDDDIDDPWCPPGVVIPEQPEQPSEKSGSKKKRNKKKGNTNAMTVPCLPTYVPGYEVQNGLYYVPYYEYHGSNGVANSATGVVNGSAGVTNASVGVADGSTGAADISTGITDGSNVVPNSSSGVANGSTVAPNGSTPVATGPTGSAYGPNGGPVRYVSGPTGFANGPRIINNPTGFANGPTGFANGPTGFANAPTGFANGPRVMNAPYMGPPRVNSSVNGFNRGFGGVNSGMNGFSVPKFPPGTGFPPQFPSQLRNLQHNVPIMPPMPFPTGEFGNDVDDESVSSMLMSWYLSGYYTGFYQGMKGNTRKNRRHLNK